MKKNAHYLMKTIVVSLCLFTIKTSAQNCVHTSQYPSSTVTIATTGTTNVTGCNYAGEYSVNDFTAAGTYYFSSVGGTGNYLTITDNSNNPVGSGYSLLGVVIPSVGIYRTHISTSAVTCGTATGCRSVDIYSTSFCNNTTQYPNSTVNVANSGTTVVTGCNYGGEYSVNNFTAAGVYTVEATGGSGNYVTVKNSAGTIIYAAGAPPLVVNIPTAGIYHIHINTSGSTSCGTDTDCHDVSIIAPAPPNDDCASAIALSVNTTTTGSTLIANDEIPAPPTCVETLDQAGVWYSISGTGNTMGVSLCSTVWDSKVFVYSGSCGTLTCVTSNNDNGPLCSGTAASATWCSTQGTPYKILVTGNTARSTFSIIVTETVDITVAATPTTMCIGSSATITAGGVNSYTWLPTPSNSTSIVVSPTATTVYTISGTAANGCENIGTISLGVSPLPTITVNSSTVCAGNIFTMIPSGASTYTFSNGSNTVIPTGSTGSYSVTGTNANGCLSASSAVSNVTVIPLPLITVSSGSVCAGEMFVIIPSGATSYTFLNGSNPVLPTVTSSYSVVGSTSIGCVSLPAVSTVTVFNLPNLTVASTPSNMQICSTNPISFTISGAATYTWNNTTSGTTFSDTPLSSSSYFVIGTDVNGCINAATIPFTVNPMPPLALSASNAFVCLGNTSTLSASGAASYSWTTGLTSTNIAVSPTITTVYGVTGTNTFGCSKTQTLAVSVNTIVLTLTSNTVICAGNSINLSAGGPSSFTWTPTNSPFASISVTPAITTTYSLNAKDSKNCFHSGAVTVSVNSNPVVNAFTSNSLICVGESATLTADGANTYTWSVISSTNNTGASIIVTPVNSNTFSYVVTGTGNNGCMNTDTVVVKADKCTGIARLNNQTSGINIYPNPNTGEFTVELNNGINKIIEVADVSGRIILSSENTDDKTIINLNCFANGVYYVKVLSDKNVEVLRVIKQ